MWQAKSGGKDLWRVVCVNFWWDGEAVMGLEGMRDVDESISEVRGITVIP